MGATIVGDKLRLSTQPMSCVDTGGGCIPGLEWSRPAEVKHEEAVATGACISYTVALGKGMAVGIGTEMRTYVIPDGGTVTVGPRVKTAVLEVVGVVGAGVVMQETSGGLWLATWDKAPSVTSVPGVTDRVLAMSTRGDNWRYLYTDRALYVVDKTLAPRWKIDGEVWSVTYQDVPLRHYALVIERGKKTRAVLRMFDEAGTQLREILVYESDDLIEARLERTTICTKNYRRCEALYLVYVATR